MPNDEPREPVAGTASEEDKDILSAAREYLRQYVEAESEERALMLDDLRFCTLDQWPQEIRSERENDVEGGPRPCLTIDKINQYIVQVVNDVRQGKPGINVRPVDDVADPETAKIIKGIVRNIEDQSNADIAYAKAVENAARIGLGYLRITTEYVSPDSFDQEIRIRTITNTFSVYLGPHVMPDGSDAQRGYIVESVPEDQFKAEYPKAVADKEAFSSLPQEGMGFWRPTDTVTVCEEFCIEKTLSELLFLVDGQTIWKSEYDKIEGDKPGIAERRLSQRPQLKWRKMTGVEVLDKRDLPGRYIPIVEVVGREAMVDGRRTVWGLTRPAKDSLRMYNFWSSMVTEKMALAPKTPFIGAQGQFEGLEERWKRANRTNFAYLEYKIIDVNGNAIPAPQRAGPTPMEAALLQQMQVIEHDVRTALGIYKAGVGESESQQSGRAILALQRESDTGTYDFGANLGVSIRHGGRIIVDMIPHYYDTARIVRILGEDGEAQTARIDPAQERAMTENRDANGAIERIYNLGVGKYDVSISVGPSYNTKRMELASVLTEVLKSQPQLMPLVGDYLFRSLDAPYSEEIAKRLKKMLPTQLQDGDDSQPVPPKAMAQIQQLGQAAQAMQVQIQELGAENQKLKAGEAEALAKINAEHQHQMHELGLQREVENEKARLAREKVEAEIALKRWVAEQEIRLQAMKEGREHMLGVRDHKHDEMMDRARMEQQTTNHETAPAQ